MKETIFSTLLVCHSRKEIVCLYKKWEWEWIRLPLPFIFMTYRERKSRFLLYFFFWCVCVFSWKSLKVFALLVNIFNISYRKIPYIKWFNFEFEKGFKLFSFKKKYLNSVNESVQAFLKFVLFQIEFATKLKESKCLFISVNAKQIPN